MDGYAVGKDIEEIKQSLRRIEARLSALDDSGYTGPHGQNPGVKDDRISQRPLDGNQTVSGPIPGTIQLEATGIVPLTGPPSNLTINLNNNTGYVLPVNAGSITISIPTSGSATFQTTSGNVTLTFRATVDITTIYPEAPPGRTFGHSQSQIITSTRALGGADAVAAGSAAQTLSVNGDGSSQWEPGGPPGLSLS